MPLHGGVLVSCRSFRHEFGPCNPPIRCFSDAFVDGFTKKNTSHDVFEKQKTKNYKFTDHDAMGTWYIIRILTKYCLLSKIYFVEFMHGIFAFIYHKS